MGTNDEFRDAMSLYCSGDLLPVIDSVVPARWVRRAWERLEAQEQMGKIVLDWS